MFPKEDFSNDNPDYYFVSVVAVRDVGIRAGSSCGSAAYFSSSDYGSTADRNPDACAAAGRSCSRHPNPATDDHRPADSDYD